MTANRKLRGYVFPCTAPGPRAVRGFLFSPCRDGYLTAGCVEKRAMANARARRCHHSFVRTVIIASCAPVKFLEVEFSSADLTLI